MADLRDLFGTGDPDEYRKKLALALTQSGMDSSPIRSPWQGAARLAQALVGASQMNDLQAESANTLREQANAERTSSGLPIEQRAPTQSMLQMLAAKLGGGNSSAMPGGGGNPATLPQDASPGNYGGSPATNANLSPIQASLSRMDGGAPLSPSGRPPVVPSPKVWGDQEAVNAGLYDPLPAKPGGPTPSPAPPAPMGAMAQAPAGFDARFAGAPMMPSPNGPNTFSPMIGGAPPSQAPAMAQGGPPMSPSGPPAPMPSQAPQAPQGAPQGQGQPSRAVPQIPPDVLQRIDALTRNPTKANLQQAQLLRQPYMAPREQYSTINDPQGNPIAQRSSLTNEVKAYPQAERWVPVPDARGNIVGFRNAITGQPMSNPMAPDNDIIRNPDGTVSFLNKKDPGAGIQSAPGQLPIETFSNAQSPGGVPAQQSNITGKISDVPRQPDAIRISREIDAEGARAGWSPQRIEETKAYRLSGLQSPITTAETSYSKGKAEDALALERSHDQTLAERQRLEVFRSLVNDFKTGKLAPAQSTIGAWADAIGVDPEKLGLPKNAAINGQLIESLSNQMTLGMIGTKNGEGGGMPANNFSDADRKFLINTVPGLARMQGGNLILADIKARGLDRQLDKVSMWDEYRAQGKSYEQFDRDWRTKVRSEPSIFADIPEAVRSLSAGAPDPSQSPPPGQGAAAPRADPLGIR